MTVDRLLFAAALSMLTVATTGSRALACDAMPIILKNVQSIPLNDQTRIALLLSMTKDQYDDANKKLDGNLSYAPSYKISYDDSRSTAELEAKASKFSFDRQFYQNYLIQFLSPSAEEEYSSCVMADIDKSRPALKVWLTRRQGDFFFLSALWISGQPGEHGSLAKKGDDFELIQEPSEWRAGTIQRMVLRRKSEGDSYAAFSVANQSAFFLVSRDPVTIPIATQLSVAGGTISRITSGGTSDGHSPFCQRRTTTGCVKPQQPGGYLVVGTGDAAEVSISGRAGFNKTTTNNPQQICIEFWAATGACETEVSIQGRATALERYPYVQPQPRQ